MNMSILSIVLVCIVAALLCLFLRQNKPEYAAFVSLACSVLVLFFLIEGISEVTGKMQALLSGIDYDSDLIGIVLKCLGICILAELGSQSCRDAGETAIATKVELVAKLSLVLVSLPLFSRLFEIAGQLLKL